MIKITSEQLNSKLANSNQYCHFIVVGNDTYLRHFAESETKKYLHQLGYEEQLSFDINNQTDWQAINDSCQSMSLFSSLTSIKLNCVDINLNSVIVNKLNELSQKCSPDVSLLILMTKITKAQENAEWIKKLSDKLVIVNCNTPDINQLPHWLTNQLSKYHLQLEQQSVNLLCYYYEGNLLALIQLLEQLSLLYPSGKISYDQLEHYVNDAAIFSTYHWIDAMLANKSKRAIHILKQLKLNDTEPLILLRTVQRELLLLINLKHLSEKQNLKIAYDKLNVWQSRRNLLTPYLTKTKLYALYNILNKLTEIEIAVKRDYQATVWEQLNHLTLLFIGSKNGQ